MRFFNSLYLEFAPFKIGPIQSFFSKAQDWRRSPPKLSPLFLAFFSNWTSYFATELFFEHYTPSQPVLVRSPAPQKCQAGPAIAVSGGRSERCFRLHRETTETDPPLPPPPPPQISRLSYDRQISFSMALRKAYLPPEHSLSTWWPTHPAFRFY